MNTNPKCVMVGKSVQDPHQNTAKSKRVNDRLRRHRKRIERGVWKSDVKSGALCSVILKA